MTFHRRIHKRSISPPFFPTKAHSTMPSSQPPSPISDVASTSSFSSSVSSLVTNPITDLDLRDRALEILRLRALTTSATEAAITTTYIDSFCRVSQGDDEPSMQSRTSLLRSWEELARRNTDMQVLVKEAVVDDGQMKVWVSSELRGLEDGSKKEKMRMEVEMLRFDKRGILVEWSSCGRSMAIA